MAESLRHPWQDGERDVVGVVAVERGVTEVQDMVEGVDLCKRWAST
jgi:hypothetical protein